jgi:hypothetical protein
MAAIVLHFRGRVEELLAFITLIAPSILIFTIGTSAEHKSISKKQIAIFAVALGHLLLCNSICLFNIQEYLLSDLGVPFGRSPSEVVEADIEPFIDLSVDLVIIIADFLRRLFLL